MFNTNIKSGTVIWKLPLSSSSIVVNVIIKWKTGLERKVSQWLWVIILFSWIKEH